ncbi:hypothetical protein GDO86_010546 [Hymenochirus boettgeri]|uniref:Uncharacterized protein n=1 Tax=Hymenochirus boettgeri TaxID=247094 RepID=A0A8T2JQY2_9PIPI|nr:hypothetical protein GDO86_010546 [Hymenochirus boettgeri]
MVFSNGENWKAMRRFTLSTLRDLGRKLIENKINEESDYLVEKIKSIKRNPFDAKMILNASVANIIGAILFGKRMDYEDPKFIRLACLVSDYVRLLGSPMVTLYNLFPALGFLPGSHKTVMKLVEELYSFIRSRAAENQKHLDENDQRSLIEAFFLHQKQVKKEGNCVPYFHEKNLLSLVKSLFSAGMETTSSTLRWGLYFMIKYSDIQEKVQDEISRVIGSAQPHYSHRTEMPYTNAVVHEIQRFADIVPLSLPHETTCDVNFKGYFIPKRTLIIPLLSSVLRDKTQFDNPEEFSPNNFLDAEGNFVKKEAFMAFSAGRRVCAGETLAWMELFIFFTSLLQKFSFRPPPGVTHIDLTGVTGLTIAPEQNMICAFPRT